MALALNKIAVNKALYPCKRKAKRRERFYSISPQKGVKRFDLSKKPPQKQAEWILIRFKSDKEREITAHQMVGTSST